MRLNLKTISLLFVCALLLAAVAAPGGAQARNRRISPAVQVVRQAGPAVVNISSTGKVRVNPFRSGDEMLDRFFQEFFKPMEREQTNLGSGVIVDGRQGLIVTNSHVVGRGDRIRVQLSDRRVFEAQVVGADPSSDLAVLKIKSEQPLPQVVLGDSSNLEIGEELVAIGNPFGLQHTVTTGVVSALNRRVPTGPGEWLGGLIQTDASINPGNSGGPILNLDGEVVGINTAIFQRAQGIGFAIPVNRVRRILNDLLLRGKVVPTWLGLELQDLTPRLAEHFQLASPSGVLVVSVYPKSPAERSGLHRGEVILAEGGSPLEDVADYTSRLDSIAPGQEVKLTVLSGSERRPVRLKARAYPAELGAELAWRRLGVSVAALDDAAANMHQVPAGSALKVLKVRPGSKAERIGLMPGDLIVRVGKQKVEDVEQFNLLMARWRHLPQMRVTFQRGRTAKSFTFGR